MRLFLNAEDTSMEPELLEAHSTPAYVEEVIRSSHRVQHSESTTVLGHSVKMFMSQCTYFAPHTEYYIDSHLQVVDLGRCSVGKDGIFNRFRHL